MDRQTWTEMVLEGWAPPEEVQRYERRIEALEALVYCPECDRQLKPQRCEHCNGDNQRSE